MPNLAATLDEYRAAFGPEVGVHKAWEDGPDGRVFVGKWTDEQKAAACIDPSARITPAGVEVIAIAPPMSAYDKAVAARKVKVRR